ncbi:MAG TPA: hypothetical protein VK778_06050, partial [Solirubrobacteraceae bacterium]|nr:hypothetical protein [Solirubrobacteraceae bacterium]
MTTNSPRADFEDRLLAELLTAVDEHNASEHLTDRHRTGSRRLTPRRVAFIVAVAVTCGAAAVGSTELSPTSGPAIASAAVISRAAAALDPANVIMYDRVSVYGWNLCLGEELPTRCFDSPAPPAGGLSRDPSADALSYSYQDWASGESNHVIYNTGDETATNAQTEQSYDPIDNTLTTVALPSSGGRASGAVAFPDTGALTPTDIRNLYAEAQRGSVQVRLGAQSTLNGAHVYELEFAGRVSEQLYVDAQTFLPVEAVVNQRTSAGTAVSEVETITAEALPATQANQALLTIGSHADAAQVSLTQSQLESRRGTGPVSVANGSVAQASAARAAIRPAMRHKAPQSLGGLNWSSQHVDRGGVDGPASWVDDGVDGQGADEVSGEAVVAAGRGA